MSEPNWNNQTVWTGDNLEIMRGMNSDSVDLIYLDPPFNSNADYAAPIGSEAAGAAFKDTWTLDEFDTAWLEFIQVKHKILSRIISSMPTHSDRSYIIYMTMRLLEMYRLLKPTGSLYLHCDPTMSHWLKIVLDTIFGKKQFRNEIVWFYPDSPGRATKDFSRKHDTILRYAKSSKWIFNGDDVRVPILETSKERYKAARIIGGRSYIGGDASTKGKIPETVWRIPVVKQNSSQATGYPTQKPIALLNRIIQASSNEGDMVFDPFCGNGTTLVAAEGLNRQWAGIDISPLAVELIERRMKEDMYTYKGEYCRTDIPERTDSDPLPKYNCKENKDKLYEDQDGGVCIGCGEKLSIKNLEVDHILAKSRGGTDHIDNLQLLCGHCNRVKGDRTQAYLIARNKGHKSSEYQEYLIEERKRKVKILSDCCLSGRRYRLEGKTPYNELIHELCDEAVEMKNRQENNQKVTVHIVNKIGTIAKKLTSNLTVFKEEPQEKKVVQNLIQDLYEEVAELKTRQKNEQKVTVRSVKKISRIVESLRYVIS